MEMSETEKELIDAAREVKRLKREVIAWSRKEGEALRLVTYSQAPMWNEYQKAEERLSDAMVAL